MKKSIVSALSVAVGAAAGAGAVRKITLEKEREVRDMSDKHLALFLMMNQWVQMKQDGKSLAEYFREGGYHNIAVYGMSYVGETLVRELKDSDIRVVYGIDEKAASIYADMDIVSMEDELEAVDAIVVTAITFFDVIEKRLAEKVNCPVISLEDILGSIMK